MLCAFFIWLVSRLLEEILMHISFVVCPFLQCVQPKGPPDTKDTSVRGPVLTWVLPCKHRLGDITGSPAYHPALCPGPSVPAQLTEAGLLGLSPARTSQVQATHPDVTTKPCPLPCPPKTEPGLQSLHPGCRWGGLPASPFRMQGSSTGRDSQQLPDPQESTQQLHGEADQTVRLRSAQTDVDRDTCSGDQPWPQPPHKRTALTTAQICWLPVPHPAVPGWPLEWSLPDWPMDGGAPGSEERPSSSLWRHHPFLSKPSYPRWPWRACSLGPMAFLL